MSFINFGMQQKLNNGVIVGDVSFMYKLVECNPQLNVVVLTSYVEKYPGLKTRWCVGLCQIYENLAKNNDPNTLFIIDEIPTGLKDDSCYDLLDCIYKATGSCLIFFKSIDEMDKYPIVLDFTCYVDEDSETCCLQLMYFEKDSATTFTI